MSLDDICEMVTDGTHASFKDSGKGFPFLTVKDMTENGLDFSGCIHISQEEYDRADAGNSAPKLGDVLFSKDGTVGKVCVVREKREFAVLSSIAILRPKKEIADSSYLGYILGFQKTIDEASKRKTGSAVRRIILKDLKQVEIPLPPLEEQQRIAAILDKADGVRRKCKEAIRLTEELLRSTFLEMFGDPVTNPKGWEIVKIENIIELVSGQVDPRESPYSNMLHVGGDNIESGTGEISGCKTPAELSLISGKYLFRKGDILYSKIRPYLNKVSLPDFDGVCSADIYPIRVNHSCVTPIYMTSILRSKGFLEYAEKHSTRTNIPKINRKALLSFECPLPPLGLQNQFTNSANKILKIKDHEKTGVDKANNLFNSLLQRAFRGEL